MSYRGLTLGNSSAPARFAASLPLLVGFLSLIGWTFDIRSLTGLLPGAVEMKANTALCAVLCGAALWQLAGRASANVEGLARASGVLVAGLGLATLGEYLFGWQLGIDELLFKDRAGVYNVIRGRMSPYSATAFAVLGLSIAAVRIKHLDRTARIGASMGLAIGMLAAIGYIWNARELITDRWLPPVAANTALCLIAIGGGILLTRERLDVPARTPFALAGVEVRILAGFVLAVFLMIFGGSFSYRNSVEFANSVEWIARTQEVRTTLADLYGSLAGAEVASRDYYLTRERPPLDEAQRLITRVRNHLTELARLMADSPEQTQNLKALRAAVENRLSALAQGQVAFHDYGIPAVRAVLAESRKISTVEDVRAQCDRMDAIEMRLLQERQATATKVRFSTLISLLITLALAIALFVTLFRGIHREIFARRSAERALRDSDQYNRSIIESSPDCVAVLTTGAHITQMNPRGVALMGFNDPISVLGKDWCTFWEGEDRQAARGAVTLARNGREARFSGVGATPDGVEKWWDAIVMPIRSAGGQPERLLAVARDITAVKRTETDLTATNQFLDSLIENLPVMVVVKDAETLEFVRLNRAFADFLGFAREDLVGKRAHDLFSQEEADFVVLKDREALAGGILVDIPQQSITTGKWGVRNFHTMKVPIGEDPKQPKFLLAMSVDITERVLAEQAIFELNAALSGKAEQLETINKELESFSYSVSHDLRAPLRAIDGFAEMLEEDYKDKFDDEGRRYLSVIRQNSRRMGALIDDLLAFSRLGRQTVNRSDINMESLVREVVDEIVTTEATNPRVPGSRLPRIEVGTLPATQGDRNLLRQVWMNLISNAVKYSSKVAEPRIKVSGRHAGTEVQYCVSDNGCGFNMEYVQKLFGVFQRLHRTDEFPGTGVGLAIVQRVVSRHGGRVWAEGKINDGALFSFALPNRSPQ
jgi:PAS domain S-box-containing protein